jgi:hypothetical protein
VNQSLIYAENLEDVSLAGKGTINGQGASFKALHAFFNRPYLIRMVNCRRVQVSDLTLLNSPMWVQHYLACEDLLVRGLSVHSRCNVNNDGIDVDACENVRIADCEFYSGDDSIVLKSTLDRLCRNVVVTNCVISSLQDALKLGTESVGGFENITMTNCAIYKSRVGIALETVDGGKLENVSVSGIVMRDVGGPIFLRLGNRARPAYKGAPQPGLGSFRNVTISNVRIVGADKIGSSISGLPNCEIENVTLDNIDIQCVGGGTKEDAARKIPEFPKKYPDYAMFGILPAYGFYCRHVKNLKLLNTQVTCESKDARPALVCEDAAGLRASDFAGSNSDPMVVLRDVRDGLLDGNRAPAGNKVYLRLEGAQTEDISLVANDLHRSEKPIELTGEVRPGSVWLSPALRTLQPAG